MIDHAEGLEAVLADARGDAAVLRRFWAKVSIGAPDQCWEWTGARASFGYGNLRVYRRYINAHRFSYGLAHGQIPAGLFVMHKCDNPPCVNPAHLAVGTARENMADAASKGRCRPNLNATGEENPSAKLTWPQVREIRRRRASGESGYALGEEFGVSSTQIYGIADGKTWKEPLA